MHIERPTLTPTIASTEEIERRAQQASLEGAAVTSPEAVLMLASLQMDQSRDDSRRVRTDQRQSRSRSRRDGIAKQRKAARAQLAIGLLNAGGKFLSSVGSNLGGSHGVDTAAERLSIGAASLAEIGSAVAGAIQSDAQADASSFELIGSEANERASDAQEYAEAMDRAAQKARDNAATVMRLRHETTMTAIRG